MIHQELIFDNGKMIWYIIGKDNNKKEFYSWNKIEIYKEIEELHKEIDEQAKILFGEQRDMNQNEKELYREMLAKDEVVKENVF